MCFACVVFRHLAPLYGVFAYIKQLPFPNFSLQRGEDTEVAIDVANDHHGPWWLQFHIADDGGNQGICPLSSVLVLGCVGPPIYIVY